ncbi:MAG TPA: O-antigen ligase family protein [Candidatus Dormibacteraeota bacterium]|nr:O-antigen ligase family protein [Candidatus Dormibacteraeota bacterium]
MPDLVKASRWALAVTLAALPAYVLRFKIGPIPSTGLEVLVIVTIVLYVVGRWREGMRRPVRTPLDIPILILLLTGLIGVIVPHDHLGALGIYRAYFIEPVLLYYVAVDLLRQAEDFRDLLVGFGVGSTAFALLQLGAWAVAVAHGSVDIRAAPEAIYTSANSVALYLEPAAALALGLVVYSLPGRVRWLALAWLVVLTAASILTLSRGLYAAFGAVVLFGIVSISNARVRWALIIAVIVIGLGSLRIPYISTRVFGVHGPETSFDSLAQRFSIWTSSIHLIRDHPIFGVGLRAYQTAIVPYVLPGEVPELYPHNVWLAFWVQVGIAGLLTFVFIFLWMLVVAWRTFQRATGITKAVLWGVVAALIMFGVHGMVDTPYYKNDLAVEFWFLAALNIAAIAMVGVEARAPRAAAPQGAPRAARGTAT